MLGRPGLFSPLRTDVVQKIQILIGYPASLNQKDYQKIMTQFSPRLSFQLPSLGTYSRTFSELPEVLHPLPGLQGVIMSLITSEGGS